MVCNERGIHQTYFYSIKAKICTEINTFKKSETKHVARILSINYSLKIMYVLTFISSGIRSQAFF